VTGKCGGRAKRRGRGPVPWGRGDIPAEHVNPRAAMTPTRAPRAEGKSPGRRRAPAAQRRLTLTYEPRPRRCARLGRRRGGAFLDGRLLPRTSPVKPARAADEGGRAVAPPGCAGDRRRRAPRADEPAVITRGSAGLKPDRRHRPEAPASRRKSARSCTAATLPDHPESHARRRDPADRLRPATRKFHLFAMSRMRRGLVVWYRRDDGRIGPALPARSGARRRGPTTSSSPSRVATRRRWPSTRARARWTSSHRFLYFIDAGTAAARSFLPAPRRRLRGRGAGVMVAPAAPGSATARVRLAPFEKRGVACWGEALVREFRFRDLRRGEPVRRPRRACARSLRAPARHVDSASNRVGCRSPTPIKPLTLTEQRLAEKVEAVVEE